MNKKYIISIENMSSAREVLRYVTDQVTFAECGVISQTMPLMSNMTVMDNIALPKSYHDRISLSKLEPLVYNLLTRYGIENLIYYHKKSLSNYEIMLVKIMRALLMEPKTIMFYMPHDMIHSEDYSDFIKVANAVSTCDVLAVEHTRFAREFADTDFKEIGFNQWQTLVTKE